KSGRRRTTHASKLAPWSSTATLPTTSLKSNKPLSPQATWSQVLACHQTRCCLVATLPTQTHSVTVLAPTSSNCQSTALSTKFTPTTSKATCGSNTLATVDHTYPIPLATPGPMKKAQSMSPGNPMVNWSARLTPCGKTIATSSSRTFWSTKCSARKNAMVW